MSFNPKMKKLAGIKNNIAILHKEEMLALNEPRIVNWDGEGEIRKFLYLNYLLEVDIYCQHTSQMFIYEEKPLALIVWEEVDYISESSQFVYLRNRLKKLQAIYPEIKFGFASWDEWPQMDYVYGFRREIEFIIL